MSANIIPFKRPLDELLVKTNAPNNTLTPLIARLTGVITLSGKSAHFITNANIIIEAKVIMSEINKLFIYLRIVMAPSVLSFFSVLVLIIFLLLVMYIKMVRGLSHELV